MRGIISKLNGTKVADLKDLNADQQRQLGGDQSLSWSAELPKGAIVLDGKWWDVGYKGSPLVSLDKDFARSLRLKVGDTLEIAISGRPISATVANTREDRLQERRDHLRHHLLARSDRGRAIDVMGALKTAPADEAGIEATLVEDFPTLDFVPVSEALAQVSTVIGSLANAVSIVGAVALLSGVFVLAGALAAGRRQREADAIVTKVLGATRGQIASAFLHRVRSAGTACDDGSGWPWLTRGVGRCKQCFGSRLRA